MKRTEWDLETTNRHEYPCLIGEHLYRHMFRLGSIRGGHCFESENVRWVYTGTPVLNHVLRFTHDCSQGETKSVGEVVGWFRRRNVSVGWFVTPFNSAEALSDILNRFGFVREADLIGMYRLPVPAECEMRPQDDVAVDVVYGHESFQKWIATMIKGFGWPKEDGWAYTRIFNGLKVTRQRPVFFLARKARTLAATCCLDVAQGVAGLYWVATIPDMRRQGIGAYCVNAAITHAFQTEGARMIVLQSAPQAVPFYRSIGFVSNCRIGVFRGPASCLPPN